MRRLLPPPEVEIAGTLDELYDFPIPVSGRAWVRGSFVLSLDGAAWGADSRSGSIANDVDRRVFPVLRRTADAILAGAGTVRSERYRASRVPIVVVSASGQLPRDLPLLADRDHYSAPVYLLTREAASVPDYVAAACTIVYCGTDMVDLHAGLAQLRAFGLSRIHCEGGPTLLASLLSAGLLDELVITYVPALSGGSTANRMLELEGIGLQRWQFQQVLIEDGTVLVRATPRS